MKHVYYVYLTYLCYVMLYCAVPCRAVPCRAVPCRAVPCRAVPCRAVPCRAVPCRAVPCRAVPCRAVPCWYHIIYMILSCDVVLLVSFHFRTWMKTNASEEAYCKAVRCRCNNEHRNNICNNVVVSLGAVTMS